MNHNIFLSLAFFMGGKLQVVGSYSFSSSWHILSNISLRLT